MPPASSWLPRFGKLRFDLPILVKDLTELAARRRTYVVRTIYALLLFGAFALFFMVEVSRRGLTYRLLGAGQNLLEFLIITQLVGVYLFLPAMVAPAIAGEKERGTLELLFTTDLGPWEILIQKYLSRLAPMFMFLLLSLPLMAVAYSLGGFSSQRLLLAAYVIFTTCMQLAAFALMFSAFCRNTSEAVGAMYSGAIVLAIVLGIFALIVDQTTAWNDDLIGLVILGGLAPAVLLEGWWGVSWGFMLFVGVLPWAWTAAFLFLAKRFLVTRAFKKNAKSMQRVMRDLGRFVGARMRMLVRHHPRSGRARGTRPDLPTDKPIAWRELSKGSLGTPGGFLLTVLMIGVPVIAASACLEAATDGGASGLGFAFGVWAVWIMSALAIAAKSVSAFSLERANQTLELLVTTPLSGREIVSQKAAAIRRRVLLAFVLLGLLFVIGASFAHAVMGSERGPFGHTPDLGPFGYLFVAFLSVPIYLSMIGWLSGWIGLKFRKQAHATAIAFGAVFGICAVPFLLAFAITALADIGIYDGPIWLLALSPATIIVMTEVGKFVDPFGQEFGSYALPIIINWIVCIGIAAIFRALCLGNADRYLGRPAVIAASDEAPAPAVRVGGGVR